jgi:ParB-like chromosome segregation protein Spo0J
MKIIKKKIKDLKPAEYNPRELTKKQYEDLRNSLEEFGVVEPVLVNVNPDRLNIVVGGHQRLRIWSEMGNEDIPCAVVDLPLDKEKELNIRLNKNGGQWDWDLLANNFDESDLIDWGFNADDVLKELTEEDAEEEPEVKFSEYVGESNNYVVLTFDNDVDWLSAQTHFDLESVHSKRANGKPWSKGIGRVVNGAEYLKSLQSDK